MKENWPRWAFASFSKHFATQFAVAPAIPLYVEGDDRDTARLKDFAEFRMDGPRIREMSKGYYRLYIPVNILVQSTMDSQDTHRIYRTVGRAVEAFTDTISIFKFGTDPVIDDSTLLVCMTLMKDKLNELKVNHFGQVDTTTRLQQATVEGHYEGFITE